MRKRKFPKHRTWANRATTTTTTKIEKLFGGVLVTDYPHELGPTSNEACAARSSGPFLIFMFGRICLRHCGRTMRLCVASACFIISSVYGWMGVNACIQHEPKGPSQHLIQHTAPQIYVVLSCRFWLNTVGAAPTAAHERKMICNLRPKLNQTLDILWFGHQQKTAIAIGHCDHRWLFTAVLTTHITSNTHSTQSSCML